MLSALSRSDPCEAAEQKGQEKTVQAEVGLRLSSWEQLEWRVEGVKLKLNQSYQITNSQANGGWICLCSGFLISSQVGLCMSVNGGDPKFEASLDIQWDPVYEKTKEEKNTQFLDFKFGLTIVMNEIIIIQGLTMYLWLSSNSQWSTSLWGLIDVVTGWWDKTAETSQSTVHLLQVCQELTLLLKFTGNGVGAGGASTTASQSHIMLKSSLSEMLWAKSFSCFGF